VCVCVWVSVRWLPVYSVTQGSTQSSAYINSQEGKVAVRLSHHGEMNVAFRAIEVVKEFV